jgi:hypothetical protein
MAEQRVPGRGIELQPLGMRVQPPDQFRLAGLSQRPGGKRGGQVTML